MADAQKLRIKIGDAEFEAEGSEASIKFQFDAFLAALSAANAAAPKALPPLNTGGNGNGTPDRVDKVPEKTLIDRVFSLGKDGIVSLKYLPKGDQKEADALLLLLYGYATLKGADAVLGTQLIQAARVSGITLDRIDRAISKHEALLLKGGARKGMRYSLNNQGRVKAEEILMQMMT